jgi:predicted MPP superfamily phosphohydrolase
MLTGDPLTFVHLSDIHFRKMKPDGRSVEDQDIRNELFLDLSQKNLASVSGILVSGDIAFSGAEHEYEIARNWLAELSAKIRCEPENVWVIPGNHDIDRTAIKDSPILLDIQRNVRSAPLSGVDSLISKYLLEEKLNPELMFAPLNNYLAFASLYSCHHKPNQPIWTDDLPLNDGSILRLVGLNTTLVSNEFDDDGANKLVLGQAQLQFSRIAGVEYLVMCHHPPQWLKDQDAVEDKLRERVRLQLFGHKHVQRCVEIDQKSVKLAAGAMHPDQREPEWCPVYNIITMNVAGEDDQRFLELRIEPRVWTKSNLIRLGSPILSRTTVLAFNLYVIVGRAIWQTPMERAAWSWRRTLWPRSRWPQMSQLRSYCEPRFPATP